MSPYMLPSTVATGFGFVTACSIHHEPCCKCNEPLQTDTMDAMLASVSKAGTKLYLRGCARTGRRWHGIDVSAGEPASPGQQEQQPRTPPVYHAVPLQATVTELNMTARMPLSRQWAATGAVFARHPASSAPASSNTTTTDEPSPAAAKFEKRLRNLSCIGVPFAPLGATIEGEVSRFGLHKHAGDKERMGLVDTKSLTISADGPHAAAPACKHYGTCGGCAFQSTRMDAQMKQKHAYIAQIFAQERGAGIQPHVLLPVYDACTSGTHGAYRYRNRAEFTIAPEMFNHTPHNEAVGFSPYRLPGQSWRHEVVAIDDCALLPPALNVLLAAVRGAVSEAKTQGPVGATLTNVVLRQCVAAKPDGSLQPQYLVILKSDSASAFPSLRALWKTIAARIPDDLRPFVAALSASYPTSIPRPTQKAFRAQAEAEVAAHQKDFNNVSVSISEPLVAARTLALQSTFLAGQQEQLAGEPWMVSSHTIDAAPFVAAWSPLLSSPLPSPVRSTPAATTPTHLPTTAVVPTGTTQLHVRVSPLAFTQPNDTGASAILSAVLAAITILQTAGLRTAKVWDLFCGNGSIGLACVQSGGVASVVGIDFNLQAIQDAVHTARLNDIGSHRVQFHCADLTSAPITSSQDEGAGGSGAASAVQAPASLYAPVQEHADFSTLMVSKAGIHLPKPDVIIVDPPRAGVGKLMLQVLLEAAPPAIIYVSCNPVTFASDCRHLAALYNVRLVQPIDQFAHTNHVENVAILVRR